MPLEKFNQLSNFYQARAVPDTRLTVMIEPHGMICKRKISKDTAQDHADAGGNDWPPALFI